MWSIKLTKKYISYEFFTFYPLMANFYQKSKKIKILKIDQIWHQMIKHDFHVIKWLFKSEKTYIDTHKMTVK